jgi:sulfite reductase (ferredoxin)
MACTGIEYCKLAIVETKQRATSLVTELERRLRDEQTDITINVNGCPNACARTQVADIGLKGQLMTGPAGEQVDGFQVHLGGGLALSRDQAGRMGRKLRGLKVTADDLPDYVERLARSYRAGRGDEGETFAQWVTRASEEELQ